jgi:FlaA1/EpsC-like NDP-sugar epimerase
MPIGKLWKQGAVFLTDAVLIVSSLLLSYALRFNTPDLIGYWSQILTILPFMLVSRLGVFVATGLYRGMWRFTGTRDLISLLKAVTVSSVLAMTLLFLTFRLEDYPRSVFIIDWFVVLVLVGGSRFGYRLLREGWLKPASGPHASAKKVLIVGAGRAGEMLLREILGNYSLNYTPIGFVDDDRKKRDMTIHGFRVMGNSRDIPRIVKKYDVTEVFLAIPTASGAAKRRIMLICKSAGIRSKTLPAVSELLSGATKVSLLREFQIEDLLGREPAQLDAAAIRDYLRGKTVRPGVEGPSF